MDAHAKILRDFRRQLERFPASNMAEKRGLEYKVRSRFHHLFDPEGVGRLTAEDVRELLRFKGNRHWKNIHRYATRVTSDMEALRRTLEFAVRESVPLADRVNDILSGGEHSIYGLGKASLTPMMWAAKPDTYGIYNGRVNDALDGYGFLPDASVGERYVIVNNLVSQLADEHDLTPYLVDFILPKLR